MEILQWPRPDAPEVILGADFLRSHRVFVSRAQGKVYFSYAGGQIFPATPGLECDDNLRREMSEEDLDHAIAADPRNAKALLRRALRRAGKDRAGALADLDEAIRLEPANGVAYQARMQLRAGMNDLAGALADSDAAMADGMRSSRLLAFRAGLFMRMHDTGRAVHELDEALLIDPRDESLLRSRGRLHFQEGRFEAAENDFKSVLALRPTPLDPVWYAISRERRGLQERAALEAGLAKLSGEAWPAPIMRYLLGAIDEQALMAAAATGDEKKQREQQCEARFYLAEHFIANGRREEARGLLAKARDECPRDFIEYQGALSELAALK
jgi:tetratricopeptide (TPR) repeat protein